MNQACAIHYTGHIIAAPEREGRFPASSEGVVETAIRAIVERVSPRAAFGSLASGADLMFVEAFLAAGADVHTFLPFAADRFLETSVKGSGPRWVDRFNAARARVASCRVVDGGPGATDDALYALTTHEAMRAAGSFAAKAGLAKLQFAVWDGKIGAVPAGAWHDIRTWRQAGGETWAIDSKSGELQILEPRH